MATLLFRQLHGAKTIFTEASSFDQEIPRLIWNSELLNLSQEPATGPCTDESSPCPVPPRLI